MPHEILSQLTAAAVVVYAVQMLKKASWFPWITQQTTHVNRVISALGALVGSLGIQLAFDSAPAGAAAGTYVLTVSGLTFSNVALGIWHWINSFAAQQLLYDGIVSKTSPQTPQAVTSVPQPSAVKAELQGAQK